MRRIMTLAVVALVMAAMMVATALPVFAAANPDSAAGRCGPPGQNISEFAKAPGSIPEAGGEAPGPVVKMFCAEEQL